MSYPLLAVLRRCIARAAWRRGHDEGRAASRVKRPHFIRFAHAALRRGYVPDVLMTPVSMFATAFVNVPEQCRGGSVRVRSKNKKTAALARTAVFGCCVGPRHIARTDEADGHAQRSDAAARAQFWCVRTFPNRHP